ncbi:hypothetical protein DFH29DRAFT_1001474 [Suillus ampliporus]|nr:hypothetical protein DFH29DRAFT_1001474 [Suillus ampliporus]
MSMDGAFTLPFTAEDLTMTVQTLSQGGPSRMARRLPKKYCDDPFIHYLSTPSSQKVNKRASKPSVLNEMPSIHSESVATKLLLWSATGSSLMAAAAALPLMVYNEGNIVYQQIMEAAEQSVLDNAVNVCFMLHDPDIKQLVCKTLAKAVSSCCHNQKFGEDWAAANLEILFVRLSEPFELIMATCKIMVQPKVECSYQLHPSAWLSNFESNQKEQMVKDLIDDHPSPLKFIFRKDEETDKRWLFEHKVIYQKP